MENGMNTIIKAGREENIKAIEAI